MNSVPLTAADKSAFDVFGCLRFPGLLADRIDTITKAFEATWGSHGGGHNGKKHDGTSRSCIVPFIDQSQELSALLEDPAIDAILTGLLGSDYNYMGSDGNYYVGDTNWHSDGWNTTSLLFLKIAFYLDPLTGSSGALRVIPGSHKPGTPFADKLHEQIHNSKQSWNLEQAEIPALALETVPGDVVVFNHNIKHSSFGGSKSRRMFTINCSQRIPEERIDIVRGYVSRFSRFWLDGVYGPAMLAGPECRMVHLEQILANQDHLPGLSAKARREMAEPSRS